ncbi:hypothetical protein [Kineosporia sp. NBRC 101731]|uniref:hypothetical protein n=1 Tax=Kineosporia sp. NBRC 101731 TaxID=3032199 RepID=UPI0024A0624F|nr:hypothetical protein [Kineosporia sp. NBRC 101731]GLY32013.1 hypothetical protein Kisp02_53780 [Kineosporia sp. NBRC 101731]
MTRVLDGTPSVRNMHGTWTIEQAACILNASGLYVTVRDLHAAFRQHGWIRGAHVDREITRAAWTYLDQDADHLVITGPGIAEIHKRLGGTKPIKVHCQVIR